MNVQVYNNIDELINIRNEWNNLLNHSLDAKIYYSYEWFVSSFKIFHSKDNVYVIVVRSDKNEIKCLAPFVIVKEKYRYSNFKKICFPRNNQNPSNDFLFEHGYEDECFNIVFDHLVKFINWEIVDLCLVDLSNFTGSHISNYLVKHNCKWGMKKNRVSPYINIENSWESFWGSKSAKFKKSMRNKINKIEKIGYSIEKKSLNENQSDALDSMLSISSKSWKRTIGTDLLSKKDNWNFYKDISSLYGKDGKISLYFLIIDRDRVAFEFHLEDKGVTFPLRADYDEQYEKQSPGSILEYEIIKQLFEGERFYEYNSCGHTYKYLMNWTNTTRELVNFEIFKKSFFPVLAYQFEYIFLPKIREYKIYESIKMKMSSNG